MIEWNPIKDAPRDGTRVLLGRSGYPVVQGAWSGKARAWVVNELFPRGRDHKIYHSVWIEGDGGPTHYAEITPVPEVNP